MKPIERLLQFMIRPWVVIGYLALIVVSYLYLDQSVALYFYNLDLKTKFPQMLWIARLGEGAFYIVLFFCAALYFRFIRKNHKYEKRAWFLWLCILVPYAICCVLKMMLGRARPELLFTEHLYGFYGIHFHSEFWSFPSGHTTTIMALVFGLSFLFARQTWVFMLLGILMVSTRILLTQHYLSDVLATSYITLGEIGLLTFWLKSHLQINEAQTPNSGYNMQHIE